jgi:hypothetical protein
MNTLHVIGALLCWFGIISLQTLKGLSNNELILGHIIVLFFFGFGFFSIISAEAVRYLRKKE